MRTGFLIIFGLFFASVYGKSLDCDIQAPIAILINGENGRILYEKQARKKTFPASTTKIATALYCLHQQHQQLHHPVTISKETVAAVSPSIRRSGKHPSYRLEFGGSHMSLKLGEQMTLRDLLCGLMVCSGNDAANAIAEHVGGTIPLFIDQMNHYLQQIGCCSTHFTNPHGLPDKDHVTSAYDLAIMTKKAFEYPTFAEIVKMTKCPRPKTNKQEESILIQSNALLKPGKFYYPHAVGVKTGYTVAAGSNLVAAAEKNGRKLIAVVLNCSDMHQRYRSCISLFETAFNEHKIERTLFSKKFDVFSKEILGAKTSLKGVLARDVVIEYFPSEEMQLSAQLEWDTLDLPIEKDQPIGMIVLKNEEGKVEIRVPLIAQAKVEPTLKYIIGKKSASFIAYLSQYKEQMGVVCGILFIFLALYYCRMKRAKGVCEDQ